MDTTTEPPTCANIHVRASFPLGPLLVSLKMKALLTMLAVVLINMIAVSLLPEKVEFSSVNCSTDSTVMLPLRLKFTLLILTQLILLNVAIFIPALGISNDESSEVISSPPTLLMVSSESSWW